MSGQQDALTAVVERLASDADTQIEYLRKLGVFPSADELALEFDDAFSVVAPILSEASRTALQRLDELLNQMSGEANANLWSADSLTEAKEWVQVRIQAQLALKELEKQ